MTIQDVLFIAGLSLVGLGTLLLGIATYIFFRRNIRDIVADLNGTKRAEALAEMAGDAGRLRRRGRTGESTGNIVVPTGGMSSEGIGSARQVSASTTSEVALEKATDKMSASIIGNPKAAATTVMEDDSSSTTVLAPDTADATTLLVENRAGDADVFETGHESEAGQSAQTCDVEAEAIRPAKCSAAKKESIPDSFHVVRKIVLTQSAEFIKPEQGENHA